MQVRHIIKLNTTAIKRQECVTHQLPFRVGGSLKCYAQALQRGKISMGGGIAKGQKPCLKANLPQHCFLTAWVAPDSAVRT